MYICYGCSNISNTIDNEEQINNFRENWTKIVKDRGEKFNDSQLIDTNVGIFNIRISSDLKRVLKFRFEFVVKDNNKYNLYEYNQDETDYNFILKDTIKKSDIDTELTVADSMDIFDKIDMQLINSLF
jgi:hypothetical protein